MRSIGDEDGGGAIFELGDRIISRLYLKGGQSLGGAQAVGHGLKGVHLLAERRRGRRWHGGLAARHVAVGRLLMEAQGASVSTGLGFLCCVVPGSMQGMQQQSGDGARAPLTPERSPTMLSSQRTPVAMNLRARAAVVPLLLRNRSQWLWTTLAALLRRSMTARQRACSTGGASHRGFTFGSVGGTSRSFGSLTRSGAALGGRCHLDADVLLQEMLTLGLHRAEAPLLCGLEAIL